MGMKRLVQIVRNHPYDPGMPVPQVIMVPVTGGHAPYLDWIDQHTR